MADTRQRLVQVARDLVHGASFADVSVEDICLKAAAHRGSFYHFFPSKDALGMAVLDANWEMMAALLDEAFSDEVSPLERIDRFVWAFGQMLALERQRMGVTPGCPLGNLAVELSAQDETARARITQILDAWARYFASAIGEAQARGEIDSSIDPSETALEILSYLQGTALMAKAYDRPELVNHAQAGIRSLLRQ